tara:strand:- start:27823 stop:28941 length:1119 start_codon:yes stop_codon:yes gene_type:complete
VNFQLDFDLSTVALKYGFDDVRVVDLTSKDILSTLTESFNGYLKKNLYGDMSYLENKIHFLKKPELILPDAKRAIFVYLNYIPRQSKNDWLTEEKNKLSDPQQAYVSVYARGRDYHKVLKKKLNSFGSELSRKLDVFNYRACVDSAPVFEVELASRAGLGWRGKNTLLLRRAEGSFFFLGALLTDCPLTPTFNVTEDRCGSCSACLDICPTKAFIGPYKLNASRCISYLTIEHKGIIDESLRTLIGNRIYGCDDCQLVCPWNSFAKLASVEDFDVRNGLDGESLLTFFSWSESEFKQRHSGSAILRLGYERWLRNISIGIGNSASSQNLEKNGEYCSRAIFLLKKRISEPFHILRPHAEWALDKFKQNGLVG